MPQSNEIMVNGLIDFPQKVAILLMEAGYCLMKMRDYKAANDVFKGVSYLLPKSDVPVIAMGNLFTAQNNLRAAEKEQEKATQKNPNSSSAYVNLAEVLLLQGKHKEGLKALDKSLELDPNGPSSKFAKSLKKAYEMKIFDK